MIPVTNGSTHYKSDYPLSNQLDAVYNEYKSDYPLSNQLDAVYNEHTAYVCIQYSHDTVDLILMAVDQKIEQWIKRIEQWIEHWKEPATHIIHCSIAYLLIHLLTTQ